MSTRSLLLFLWVGAPLAFGQGSPFPGASFPAAPLNPNALGAASAAAADLDGDGDFDAACAVLLTGRVAICRGDGSGSLGFPEAYVFGASTSPRSVEFGDLNGDGKPDLVAALSDQNAVGVRLNAGGAALFGGASDVSLVGVGAGPRKAILVDLNLDGDLDLVASNHTASSVTSRLGNGNGTFGAASTLAVGFAPTELNAYDYTSDGKPDVAVLFSFNAGAVGMLAGDGSGGFSFLSSTVVGQMPSGMARGDFNLDGKVDLLVSNQGTNTISMLSGNGTGGFVANGAASSIPAPTGIVVLDGDGDGKLDAATTNRTTAEVTYFRGLGTNVLGAQEKTACGPEPSSLALGDFNSDGRLDALALSGSTARFAILPGKAGGGFQGGKSQMIPGGSLNVASGDFDSDGDVDLVVAGYPQKKITLLLNDGAGSYSSGGEFATTGKAYQAAVGDLNHDSFLDLAVASFEDPLVTGTVGTVSILLGDGHGGFTAAPPITIGERPNFVEIADLNGDTHADLLICDNGLFPRVHRFDGSGTGSFSLNPQGPDAIVAPSAVAARHLDNDGILDVVVLDYFFSQVLPYRGTASGGYLLGNPVSLPITARPTQLAWIDFDEDGDDDLVTANDEGGSISTIRNLGNGGLATVETIEGVGIRPQWIAVGDFDRDGHKDLAVTVFHPTDSRVAILRGDGNSGFEATSSIAVGLQPWGLATGDFNADGKSDLAAANFGSKSVSLFLNADPLAAGIHTYGTGSPGCGGAQILDTNIPPVVGSDAFAFTCTHGPRNALGFGLIRETADEAGTDVLGINVLFHVEVFGVGFTHRILFESNSVGFAIAPMPIPDDASLVGRVLYLQAFWPWPGDQCFLPPAGISSSNGLQFEILSK
ncbi:MAG: VCBS repeat-containing protein [Planctomycetes bacterium]|nr:VCBS repeat-containing protein [Planctomycetota bacterium]